MPSRFDSQIHTRARPNLHRQFGVAVVLKRGNAKTESFVARRMSYETLTKRSEAGIPDVRFVMRSFVMPIASVIIDGEQTKPRTGDRIIEDDFVFEVQPMADGKAAVEPTNSGHDWIVHAKLIS